MATAGYIVHVADGTYNEQVTTNSSGTASAYITYVSDNKWGAKIVSPGTGTTAAWQNNGDYVAILGFDVTGGGAVGINHSGSGDIASYNHVHNIPAVGCTGYGGAGIGFDNYNGKSGFLADSNVVNDIGPLGTTCFRVQGIYPSIPNGTVSNNIIYRVVGYAINTGHNSYTSKIVNNTMFGNGNPSLDGGGIVITANDFATQSHGFIVANNIIYDNQGIGVHEEGSQGANTYTNNLIYGNNTNWGNLGSSHTSDVAAAPQFVNYIRTGGGNYRLGSTSPAIGKGSTSYAPSTDFDAAIRSTTVNDLGAYKY
ncbi:right-handed parallel beta-helix repeat-containing protein [Herminiimonas sp. CN]|uniref:right-handed parallel beta-helix repeat-containing protein n=1 Tax=Herminiimonas sp. CN TaxID=1349818 RepID=UPI001EE6773C|nr:right-handed parallel beta-helix repeat-containing protein [Herminiimonas sp. CN]